MSHLTLTPEQLADLQSRIATSARKVPVMSDREAKLERDLAVARAGNAARLGKSAQERAGAGIPTFVQGEVAGKGRKQRQRAPGKPGLPESAVLRACMEILEAHPKVSIWWRQNTGAVRVGERYLKFSFRGASDLMGVMAGSGRFLAIECKATGQGPSDDQAAFLRNVSLAGGYSMCVDNPGYLASWLERI